MTIDIPARRYKYYLYRLQNKDKIKASNNKYRPTRDKKRREEMFGTRTCRICEILLVYGAERTTYYCRLCRDRGLAQKDINKRRRQKYSLKCKQKKHTPVLAQHGTLQQ